MRNVVSKRVKWIFIAVVIGLFVVSLWGAAFFLSSRAPGASRAGGEWKERALSEGEGSYKVAMITVAGEIFSDPEGIAIGASDENIIRQLDQAEDDDEVAAVILDLNTPGGGVVASDNIYKRILDFKKQKPVIALMGDTAASGGYYIAAAASEIVANSATVTGSIGVIMILPNLEGTAGKLGIKPVVIKSGQFKDIGSPFREMTASERDIFQRVIDEAYAQFVESVASGRHMEADRVRQIADGRIYTGRQAKELGLVDQLGGRDVALSRAESLAKISDSTLVLYEKSRGLAQSLLGLNGNSFSGKQVIKDALGIDLGTGLKYLWIP